MLRWKAGTRGGTEGYQEQSSSSDADPRDLTEGKVALKPTLRFGHSLVSRTTVDFYVSKGYFSEGVARSPGDEVIPRPNPDEVVVFCDWVVSFGVSFHSK